MGILDVLFGGKTSNNIKKDKTNYNQTIRYDTRSIEAESRLKVINESLAIMERTKNIDTLNIRYDTVCEHMNWMKENNFELNNESAYNAKCKVDNNKNENIVRIAYDAFNNYECKFKTLKTPKAKENSTIKIFKLLDDCINSIVPSENIVLKRKILILLRNKVEDLYSKIQ